MSIWDEEGRGNHVAVEGKERGREVKAVHPTVTNIVMDSQARGVELIRTTKSSP